ncbi:2-hydroxychromene-2-carboxylate isomerase [Parasphingorhabdus sp.]|jgi:2-hydroxychromene-2-carboxylate isomerase|uniref:2-hydroxychromene-2-carboxylate isomerase n=1 Tax=Parasphingorhabdus sp. TaxID=2709688 RepID=UPI003D2B3C3F
MTESVDVYWSFRSPYSYLVTPDLLKLAKDFDVDVNLRVVLPIAIRNKAALFDASNRKPTQYILMDWERRAEFLGRPHAWPNPDPVVQDYQTMAVSEDQPYIFRLSQLGVEAQRCGQGINFVAAVSHLIFGGTANWHQGDHLNQATASCGLDLESMEAAMESGDHLAEIERNQDALEEAGHWGVPTMVIRGEPFFGQDRIDTLRWRLGLLGLSKK